MKTELQILKEKIAVVEADLAKSGSENGGEKKRITLVDYLDYLKDELKMLEAKSRIKQ